MEPGLFHGISIFHEITTFSWNLNLFMKSRLFLWNLLFRDISPFSWNFGVFIIILTFSSRLHFSWNFIFFMKSRLVHEISTCSWNFYLFQKILTFSRNLEFFVKSWLFHEISMFSWNLNFLMKSQLFLEISTFYGKTIISTLLPHSTPCRSTDSGSIILDLCRSTDSEFILLGPVRAIVQNSSESQNFGVIKKLTHAKCSAQRNRQRHFNAFSAFCLRLVRANAHRKRTQGWQDIVTQSCWFLQIIL